MDNTIFKLSWLEYWRQYFVQSCSLIDVCEQEWAVVETYGTN